MAEPLRVANCSGFYGDRLSAAAEMVDGGPIDVLTGDWLAELTMLILARSRMQGRGGYARTFVRQMEQVMGTCLDRGIKVVSNAGGLDPVGCAEAVAEVADRLGLAPRIAYVDGDDLLPRIGDLVDAGALTPLDPRLGLGDPGTYVAAHAYLGGWPIVEALRRGADIVITGRVTDAAVACAPAAWHHGWSPDDLDALAGAVVAGHILECGTQATGGNYSFFHELRGYDDPAGGAKLGFPWAEIAEDGTSIIGKHDGTGGAVTVDTVTAQLLYEIGGPRYLGPDVTARFDTIRLRQVGPDRVAVEGVRGEPAPSTLKVGINELWGYRNGFRVALTGLDVEEKARFVEAAFLAVLPWTPDDYAVYRSEVIRSDKEDPPTNEEATAVWRVVVKDRDERKVGRAFTAALVETALASVPGFYGLDGGPSPASPVGVFRPAVVPADLVPAYVHIDGEVVEVPTPPPVDRAPTVEPPDEAPTIEAGGAFVEVPLGRVAGARSGDKGGDANLGVWVRSDAAWAWLDATLTVDALRALLPEVAPLRIERHRFPNLRALNFVIHGLLEEGVAAATRQDAQAKSLGEWLRARVVAVPATLLDGDPRLHVRRREE